jgi:hypothetical protein
MALILVGSSVGVHHPGGTRFFVTPTITVGARFGASTAAQSSTLEDETDGQAGKGEQEQNE